LNFFLNFFLLACEKLLKTTPSSCNGLQSYNSVRKGIRFTCSLDTLFQLHGTMYITCVHRLTI